MAKVISIAQRDVDIVAQHTIKNSTPKDHKPATSREVQPQLRKLVLKRDNWMCVKCNRTDTLHCHHIDPVKNNPIESADVNNCVTLCIDCHKESHQVDGCGYNELKGC